MKDEFKKAGFRYIYLDGDKTDYILNQTGECINLRTMTHAYKRVVNGRTLMNVYHNKKYHTKYLSRWLGMTFLEPPEGNMDDYDVDHIDGNRSNDEICNLQWLDKHKNKVKSIYEDGNLRRGQDNGNATITDDEARHAVELFIEGYICSEIDTILGFGKGIANSIMSGRNWKHILAEYPEVVYTKRPSQTKYDDDLKDKIYNFVKTHPYYSNKEVAKALDLEWFGPQGKTKSLISRIRKKVEGSTTIEQQPAKLIIKINLSD